MQIRSRQPRNLHPPVFEWCKCLCRNTQFDGSSLEAQLRQCYNQCVTQHGSVTGSASICRASSAPSTRVASKATPQLISSPLCRFSRLLTPGQRAKPVLEKLGRSARYLQDRHASCSQRARSRSNSAIDFKSILRYLVWCTLKSLGRPLANRASCRYCRKHLAIWIHSAKVPIQAPACRTCSCRRCPAAQEGTLVTRHFMPGKRVALAATMPFSMIEICNRNPGPAERHAAHQQTSFSQTRCIASKSGRL